MKNKYRERLSNTKNARRFASRVLKDIETVALRLALTLIFLYGLLRVILRFAKK